MSRLTLLHINIIGAVVAILVGVALYFTIITGAQETIKKNDAELKEVQGRAEKLTSATNHKKKAETEQAKAKTEYAGFERQYMPIIGYKDQRLPTMMHVFWPNNGKSWPERFIRTFRAHMNRESKVHGITWDNPGVLQLGPYGPDPNAIDAASPGEGLGPVLHYSFPMTVHGKTMASLLRHVQAWPTVTGIGVPVVDGFQVAGNTPNLTANYTLTLTIIVHERIPEKDSRVSGSGGGAGGRGGFGGGFGGRGGGMSMGPMMSPGGPMGGGGLSRGPMSGGPMGGGSMSSGPMGSGMGGRGGARRGGAED